MGFGWQYVSLRILNDTKTNEECEFCPVGMGREDSDWLRELSALGFEACGQIKWENERTVAVKRGGKIAGRTHFKPWETPSWHSLRLSSSWPGLVLSWFLEGN